MKKLPLIITIAALAMFSACGGGDSSDNSKQDKQEEKSEQTDFLARDGLITGDIPEKYTIEGEGINADGDHRLYIIIDNDSEFYESMEYDYAEMLDENKETEIDGLPAITNKRKYQANGDMIARSWLVYNGIDQILITVQAPAENWNDAVAEDMVSYLKITERGDDVRLPVKKEAEKHIRPDEFPEAGVDVFADAYSDELHLSEELIQRCMDTYNGIHDLTVDTVGMSGEEMQHLTDSLMNDVYNWEDVKTYYTSMGYCLGAYDFMTDYASLQEMDAESDEYKVMKDIMMSATKQMGFSKADVRFVYDNWELCKELDKLVNKDQ
ncbi:MAG TPA: hypothetical protein VJ946_09260 [Bacteroidales bacterium]|nr:hypothetical protein [Bacteroidales bacterium]